MIKSIEELELIDVKDNPPPFDEPLLIEMRGFFVCGLIQETSPNDTDPKSEYYEFMDEEGNYTDYQFYILPMHNAWFAENATEHDCLDYFSDDIEKWFPLM